MKVVFVAMLALLFISSGFAADDDTQSRVGQVDREDCKVVATGDIDLGSSGGSTPTVDSSGQVVIR